MQPPALVVVALVRPGRVVRRGHRAAPISDSLYTLGALSYREVATRPLVHGVRSTQAWVASVRSSVVLRLRKAVYLVLLAADGPSIFAVTARGWLKIPTSQNERV